MALPLNPQGLIQPEEQPTSNPTNTSGNTVADINAMVGAAGITDQNIDAMRMAERPQDYMTNMMLSDRTPELTEARGTTVDSSAGDMVANQMNYAAQTAGDAQTVANVAPAQAMGFEAVTSTDRVTDIGQATAQTGDVRPEAIIDVPQLDMQGLATGFNRDGSTNFTGQALNQTATQNISQIIDTSTVSGKLLAQSLGEGNYTDAKATLQGQMALLSEQFVDAAGNPTIPTWAAGTARAVSRIAAFKGMTGTAATAAMSQAIMEASIPIAQADSQFFQTVTMQNLNNRQQTTINTANVLSKMELANLDSRMVTAVENAKNFMAMDLANLNNEQQAEIINTQARVQSILEDSKAQNAARLFSADAQNDFSKFYDQLGTQISQFNAAQTNAMRQFNTGEINSASQFNASLENQREQFYRDMQFNVDMANARWRQTIETSNTQMQFVAAQTDIQNMFNMSRESLNRVWDRADALLDYTWKSSENEADRQNRITLAQMQIDAERAKARGSAIGSIFGAIGKLGAAAITASDMRLKDDLEQIDTLPSGIKVYKWNWNSEARRIGADQYPPFGVLAQEVLTKYPYAVSKGDHGYYTVDYSKVK